MESQRSAKTRLIQALVTLGLALMHMANARDNSHSKRRLHSMEQVIFTSYQEPNVQDVETALHLTHTVVSVLIMQKYSRWNLILNLFHCDGELEFFIQ